MNVYLLLLFAIIAYSCSVILEKKTMNIIEAREAIFFKGILYMLFAVITFIVLKLNNVVIIDNKYKDYKKAFGYLFTAYLLIFLLGNFLYYYIIRRTNEITKLSFMLIVFNTITIVGLPYFFRGERINFMTFLGILIALAGVAITLLN